MDESEHLGLFFRNSFEVTDAVSKRILWGMRAFFPVLCVLFFLFATRQ